MFKQFHITETIIKSQEWVKHPIPGPQIQMLQALLDPPHKAQTQSPDTLNTFLSFKYFHKHLITHHTLKHKYYKYVHVLLWFKCVQLQSNFYLKQQLILFSYYRPQIYKLLLQILFLEYSFWLIGAAMGPTCQYSEFNDPTCKNSEFNEPTCKYWEFNFLFSPLYDTRCTYKSKKKKETKKCNQPNS